MTLIGRVVSERWDNAAGRVQGRQFSSWYYFLKDVSSNMPLEGFLISAKMCKTFFYLPSCVLTGPDLVPALPPTFRNCSDPKI